MNKLKNLFLVCGILGAFCASTVSSIAQGRGFDCFEAPRTVVLSAPQNIIGASVGNVTNGPVDTRMLDGICSVDLFSCTNNGATGGVLTATLYTSPDQTNLTAIGSIALTGTSTTILYTNNFYGTGLVGTNAFLLPGAYTSPTAATAGFATSYFASPAYMNSGAITVSAKGYYKAGFNIGDQNRYLYIVWTPTGTATNWTVGASLTSPVRGSLR